ncbi:protein YgfX [Nevskia sp.]|uniref:protein YgfX n=1 Tax=Nevskia sp. TaxID=1929292 RepID=UPI0025E0AD56|nr:protein YgfX [Nevskia sp.]
MSSNSFNATIDLRPRASLRGLQGLVIVHVVAAALVFAAQPPDSSGLLLSGLLMLSWFSLRRHSLLGFGPKALTRLTWHAADHTGSAKWTVENGNGASFEATLLPSSIVKSQLMLLNFQLADGVRRSRALFGDEADPELLRRLSARLLSGEALTKPTTKPKTGE